MGMAIISATSVPRHSTRMPSRCEILRSPSSVPVYTLLQAGPHTAGAPGAGCCTRTHSHAAKDHFLLGEGVRAGGSKVRSGRTGEFQPTTVQQWQTPKHAAG